MELITGLFSGRMNRLTFLVSMIQLFVITLIIAVIVGIFLDESSVVPVAYLITALMSIFNIAIIVRRFHDLGLSGWYSLLLLVPIVNLVTLLALYLVSGQSKVNKYGPIPSRGISTFLKISSGNSKSTTKKRSARR